MLLAPVPGFYTALSGVGLIEWKKLQEPHKLALQM